MTTDATDSSGKSDAADVVIIGGGPAGCSAGVFTARYGFDTTIFDRGNAALKRCAYLENYLGFPAGIGVDTFRDLMHAHAETAGCEIIPETVISVEREEEGEFTVECQDGRKVCTEYVLVAAWYDGSYLRPLDRDGGMFHEHEHHGEVEERFDPAYPDDDGRTPVEGLYVASPAGSRSAQAIVAAGNGAHVARCLIEDHRRNQGYSGGVAPHYDWLRPTTEFTGEWADRDRWREWFANELDDDANLDEERRIELRETYIDEAFETQISEAEVEAKFDQGLGHLIDILGPERVLDVIDDDRIRTHLNTPSEQ